MPSSNLDTECHSPCRLTASHLSHRSFCLGSPFKLAPIVASTVNARVRSASILGPARDSLSTPDSTLSAVRLNMYHYAAGMALPLLGCPNEAGSPPVVQYLLYHFDLFNQSRITWPDFSQNFSPGHWSQRSWSAALSDRIPHFGVACYRAPGRNFGPCHGYPAMRSNQSTQISPPVELIQMVQYKYPVR